MLDPVIIVKKEKLICPFTKQLFRVPVIVTLNGHPKTIEKDEAEKLLAAGKITGYEFDIIVEDQLQNYLMAYPDERYTQYKPKSLTLPPPRKKPEPAALVPIRAKDTFFQPEKLTYLEDELTKSIAKQDATRIQQLLEEGLMWMNKDETKIKTWTVRENVLRACLTPFASTSEFMREKMLKLVSDYCAKTNIPDVTKQMAAVPPKVVEAVQPVASVQPEQPAHAVIKYSPSTCALPIALIYAPGIVPSADNIKGVALGRFNRRLFYKAFNDRFRDVLGIDIQMLKMEKPSVFLFEGTSTYSSPVGKKILFKDANFVFLFADSTEDAKLIPNLNIALENLHGTAATELYCISYENNTVTLNRINRDEAEAKLKAHAENTRKNIESFDTETHKRLANELLTQTTTLVTKPTKGLKI